MQQTIVTFTGVDAKTDLTRLDLLQEKYPQAEFGVLLSESRKGKENRYPDIGLFQELKHHPQLNLALHICGNLAGNALQTDFENVTKLIGWHSLMMFRRIQINGLSELENLQGIRALSPINTHEVIIQQNPKRPLLTDERIQVIDAEVSFLYDGSGGLGVETPFKPLQITRASWPNISVGYAGGINPDNVLEKWHEAKRVTMHNGLWIDMETGVRTNDWFDLDKVEAVLRKMFPLQ